ncbi:MAG: sugar ABC transporter permease [Clostridiales Family XIII bacterium]|jgi:multiple sugar transport system permease protein|nr:sugar ABC transporter permease [Clostridiales Family XIII bacterium]
MKVSGNAEVLPSENRTFREWFRSKEIQQRVVIAAFIALPIFLLIMFTYVPFLQMFKFSFYDMKYIGPRKFIGIQNYLTVFTRDDCFKALALSGYYIIGAFIQLAIALYFASILCFKTTAGGVFKGVLFFPYLISGIAIGFLFKFFYTRGFVLDTVLSWIGFDENGLPYWLKDTSINNFSLVFTSFWKYMGQNMVLFLGAMMSVDATLYEAADIDGANSWHKFRFIMLPSIKQVIVLNLILSISGSLSAFEPPFVITNGQFGTGTYFVIMDRIAHQHSKVGLASAMAIVLMIIIFIVTIFQQVVMKKFFPDDEDGVSLTKRKKVKGKKVAS